MKEVEEEQGKWQKIEHRMRNRKSNCYARE